MRIFLDANILFSAAKSTGAIHELIDRMLASGHELVADDYVIAEARRNLERKGPDALGRLDALLCRLTVNPARAPGPGNPEIDWLPDKDRPVLSAAIRAGCQALVTGDRTHFGPGYGKSFAGVTIHSPRTLAESLHR